MQVFLSVAPRDVRTALQYHSRLAHAAYRIGGESRLLRQNLLQTRGGLLSLSDCGAPPISKPETLCREILQECNLRGYSGVLADFEETMTRDRILFLGKLCSTLRSGNRRLFLPEPYAARITGATAIICTALSGGSLIQRLEEMVGRFGRGQVAMDIQRLSMDFTLPAPSGMGTPLKIEELQALLRDHTPSTFYSRDLCARYFTYVDGTSTHFVLYDDAETIRQKIRTGRDMGFCAAFLMFPEVRDLLPSLFDSGRKGQ